MLFLGKHFANFPTSKSPQLLFLEYQMAITRQKWSKWVTGFTIAPTIKKLSFGGDFRVYWTPLFPQNTVFHSDYIEIPNSKLRMEVYWMLKQQQPDHICHVFYISALQISNKIKSLNTDSTICQGLQLLVEFVGDTNKKIQHLKHITLL